jgi:hypothetical protein
MILMFMQILMLYKRDDVDTDRVWRRKLLFVSWQILVLQATFDTPASDPLVVVEKSGENCEILLVMQRKNQTQ